MIARLSRRRFWRRGVPHRRRTPLAGYIDVEIAVVGAGITGLTTAMLLAREGRTVAVLEADQVGAGTSGDTSAHVTDVLDIRYATLLSRAGERVGRVVVERAAAGLDLIAETIAGNGIDCDMARVPAYLYVESAAHLPELGEEHGAAARLGRLCEVVSTVPLPWSTAGAIRFPDQIAFQPVRYLYGLADAALHGGAALFEGTPVTAVNESGDGGVRLETPDGQVRAQHVVLATHTPIGFHLIQTEVAPYRSYIVAFDTPEDFPPGLFFDTGDPYHYLRSVRAGGGSQVLVGGADHKTGQGGDPAAPYAEIESWAATRLAGATPRDRWSAQLYEPADGLPYVGRSPGTDNIYIATGLSGTGLVGGTMAALELASILRGEKRENPFDPARLTLAAAPRLLSENANVMARWIGDRLNGGDAAALREVRRGEGRIIRLEGKRRAVFRDSGGFVHVLSPVCPHMGCQVRWNGAESSWDCPCHGARFAPTGEVREGPPLRGLERVELEDECDALVADGEAVPV